MKTALKNFLLILPLTIITLFVPIILSAHQGLSALLLLVIALAMLRLNWSAKVLVFYSIVAITGPIFEMIAIHFGIWAYASPFFLGVPIWLPFAWGNAGLHIVAIKRLVDSF